MDTCNDCIHVAVCGDCFHAELCEKSEMLIGFSRDNPAYCSMFLNSADVATVRHGRWVSVPHKLARICSVCNRDEPYKFADIDADVYDYCPNCGAKMDGGAGNGC